MAAEIVGTAYVRIRAITAGLAKDISDGVDKGVADAAPSTSKAGEGLGSDISAGAGKSLEDDFGKAAATGVTEGLGSPDVHKAGQKGGEGVAGDVSKGFEDGTKKKNPFRKFFDSMSESFSAARKDNQALGGGVVDDVSAGMEGESKKKNPFARFFDGLADGYNAARNDIKGVGEDVAEDFGDGVDEGSKRRNPFSRLFDGFRRAHRDVIPDIKHGGEEAGDAFGDGVDEGTKKRNPFRRLWDGVKFWMPRISLEFGDGGEDSGEKFGDGFEKGAKKSEGKFKAFGESLAGLAPKPVNWLAIFGPTTLAPIVGSIVAMIGLVVQVLGFVVTAAAGAGAALAGIAAVALPGMAALFAAFKTETKQLKDFKENVKKALEPWKQFGIATQQTLLPGLQTAIEMIGHLAPLFVEFGGRFGKIISGFAVFAAHILTSEDNMKRLAHILEISETFFTNIRTAALHVVNLLLPFLDAAAPLAAQFSESLAEWAQHFDEFIQQKSETGELTTTFQTWYDRLSTLVSILGNVFKGLWNILSIASEGATPFFDKLAEAAEKFAEWTSSVEGKNRIKKFFDDIKPVLDEVWDLIKNLFNLIVKPAAGEGGTTMLQRLADALHWLNTVLENPLTAKVVPYLLGVATGLSALSFAGKGIGALAQIGENIGKFADALWKLSTPVRWLTEQLGKLAWTITKVLVQALWDLSAALLTTPAGWVLLAIAAAAIAVYVAFRNWDTIVEWLKLAWEWFTKLSTPLKILVGIGAGLLLLVNPIAQFAAAVLLVTAALKNWDAIAAVIDRVWDTIYNFFTNLPTLIPQAMGAIQDWFQGPFLDALWGVVTTIIGFFERLPTTIHDLILDGLRNLPQWILDAVGALWEVGENILGLLAEGFQRAAPRVIQFFVELPSMILSVLQKVLPALARVGREIIEWLITGLVRYGPKIMAWAAKLPWEILTVARKALVAIIKFGIEMVVALVQGLIQAGPSIIKWFKDLPGNLLSMLATAAKWLWETGILILQGLLDGIKNNAGRLMEFFKSLPGLILEWIGDVVPFLFQTGVLLLQGLWDGAKSVFASMSEFFGGLPQQIVDFIVAAIPVLFNLGMQIPAKILEGVVAGAQAFWDFFTNLPTTILNLLTGIAGMITDLGIKLIGWIKDGLIIEAHLLWDFFTNLPQTIWDTVVAVSQKVLDLGSQLITWLLDGLKAVASTLWQWFTDLPQTIWDTVVALSQKVIDLGKQFITWLLEGIYNIETDLWDFFTGLPQKIWDTVSALASTIVDLGKQVIQWVLNGIYQVEQDIWDFFKDLPQKVFDTVVAVGSKLFDLGKKLIDLIIDGIKSAPGALVDAITSLIPGPLKGLASHIPGIGGLFGEMGGIIPGSAFGIPITVGEKYRAEAIVPMTRPARAMAVMQQAGLDKLVLDAYMGGSVSGGTGVAAHGDVTMLKIDSAVMTAPVDADMLVQKITAAYNRMAS